MESVFQSFRSIQPSNVQLRRQTGQNNPTNVKKASHSFSFGSRRSFDCLGVSIIELRLRRPRKYPSSFDSPMSSLVASALISLTSALMSVKWKFMAALSRIVTNLYSDASSFGGANAQSDGHRHAENDAAAHGPTRLGRIAGWPRADATAS